MRIAAVAGLAQPAAGGQHRVAFAERGIGRGDHMAGDIDAADQREAAQDLALAGAGQRVLEVDRGVRRPDHQLAGIEIPNRDRFDAAAVTVGIVVDPERAEAGGNAHTSSGVSLSWPRRFSSSHLSACAGT